MKRLLMLSLVFVVSCASLPAKQRAVVGLQTVGTALGVAQDFEMANHAALGLDVVASDAHRKLCPTSALPAPLPAGATEHQVISCLFVQAFASYITSGAALQNWTAGQPMPSFLGNLKGQIDVIFGIAQGLSSNVNQQAFVMRVQETVDGILGVVTVLGGVR